MTKLTEEDLKAFQTAVFRDYGIQLESTELYEAAFNLLMFIEYLIKFSQQNENQEGSKSVHANPLNTKNQKNTIK